MAARLCGMGEGRLAARVRRKGLLLHAPLMDDDATLIVLLLIALVLCVLALIPEDTEE